MTSAHGKRENSESIKSSYVYTPKHETGLILQVIQNKYSSKFIRSHTDEAANDGGSILINCIYFNPVQLVGYIITLVLLVACS